MAVLRVVPAQPARATSLQPSSSHHRNVLILCTPRLYCIQRTPSNKSELGAASYGVSTSCTRASATRHGVSSDAECLSPSPSSQPEELRVYSDDDRGRALPRTLAPTLRPALPRGAHLYSDSAAARRRRIVLELLWGRSGPGWAEGGGCDRLVEEAEAARAVEGDGGCVGGGGDGGGEGSSDGGARRHGGPASRGPSCRPGHRKLRASAARCVVPLIYMPARRLLVR